MPVQPQTRANIASPWDSVPRASGPTESNQAGTITRLVIMVMMAVYTGALVKASLGVQASVQVILLAVDWTVDFVLSGILSMAVFSESRRKDAHCSRHMVLS